MAETVKSHDFGIPPNRKYPWELWQNGAVWRIVRGDDFPKDLNPRTMRAQINVRSKYIQRRVRTQVLGDTVVFTFQAENETPEQFQCRIDAAGSQFDQPEETTTPSTPRTPSTRPH